jgi:hypothetical protein
MRAAGLSILAVAMLWGGLSVQAASPSATDLRGAWRLVSVETIRPNGEVIYPFYGKHAQGLIIYDPTGWMSVQIISDPKPTVPAGNSRDKFKNARRQKRPSLPMAIMPILVRTRSIERLPPSPIF